MAQRARCPGGARTRPAVPAEAARPIGGASRPMPRLASRDAERCTCTFRRAACCSDRSARGCRQATLLGPTPCCSRCARRSEAAHLMIGRKRAHPVPLKAPKSRSAGAGASALVIVPARASEVAAPRQRSARLSARAGGRHFRRAALRDESEEDCHDPMWCVHRTVSRAVESHEWPATVLDTDLVSQGHA